MILYNLNIKANNLLKNTNYSDIKNFDIIQVQVDHFDYFYDEILPILKNNGIKIILITSQWHLPQIHKSEKTDNILNDENILLWVSQNPIYFHTKKYMAFPYGLNHTYLTKYINFVKEYKDNKTIKILNQKANVHGHIPSSHIRKKYDIFGINSGPNLDYLSFLNNISNAEFVISTSGDRDDCYRHYECIGLNAIPVSNINYIEIFGENMINSNPEEMINMITTQMVEYNYSKPNRDMLTIHYWNLIIRKIIDELLLI